MMSNLRLALKRFRGEPAISGLDWLFTPIHSSSQAFSTATWFGPPPRVNEASPWPWIARPVSGLPIATHRPIQTRFRYGSGPETLNLAATDNSPVRYAKSTPSGAPHLTVRHRPSDCLSAHGFRYYFTPLPGCFSPFPHGTSSLSVARSI